MRNKNLSTMYNLIREIGIAGKVFPANFPMAGSVRLTSFYRSDIPYAGMGGVESDGRPSIEINTHGMAGLVDMLAILAHEMLHVKQCLHTKSREPNHGNDFRRDCAILARLLGVPYYQLNAYDMPSVKTVKAQAKKKIDNIRHYHNTKKAR